jgi:glycine/D-amino acid oxidase-like deaminating enzyme
MGYSRDNKPWIGEMPGMKGLFIAAGYTGHGLPNGPMCAKAVVEMILDGRTGEEIVSAGRLPEDYLLTGERMREAMKFPSLIEDDYNPKEL